MLVEVLPFMSEIFSMYVYFDVKVMPLFTLFMEVNSINTGTITPGKSPMSG